MPGMPQFRVLYERTDQGDCDSSQVLLIHYLSRSLYISMESESVSLARFIP
jgi:hypothetical protein